MSDETTENEPTEEEVVSEEVVSSDEEEKQLRRKLKREAREKVAEEEAMARKEPTVIDVPLSKPTGTMTMIEYDKEITVVFRDSDKADVEGTTLHTDVIAIKLVTRKRGKVLVIPWHAISCVIYD